MTGPDGATPAAGVRPDDPQRPVYHFLPEANWLNDPNGLIQWRGQYHVFYQYNPNGPFHGTVHWGHAVSSDLVNWRHLPVALAPSPDGPDRDGCFSGCAVDNNGVPTFIYTGVNGPAQLPCVATSADDLLVTWEKYTGNPVIPAPPADLDLVAYRDHSVWQEDGSWYMLIGAGLKDQGGTALLYRSPDLYHWEYLHPILVGDSRQTEPVFTGQMWECPSMNKLGDKHALIISVWDHDNLYYSAYFMGDFNEKKFQPQTLAILDNGGSFYAPQTMQDDHGRRLMWGWLQEQSKPTAWRASGWSGALTLPRVLSVTPDGRLAQAPVPELAALRGSHQLFQHLHVPAEEGLDLLEGEGDCLEIKAEFEPGGATQTGLLVRCAPDDSEQTLIAYDWQTHELVIDRTKSSLDPEVVKDRRSAACPPGANGRVTLYIFLDRSIIEVFANNEVAMASRVYPTRPDSLGVRLVAAGGPAVVNQLDVWKLSAANIK